MLVFFKENRGKVIGVPLEPDTYEKIIFPERGVNPELGKLYQVRIVKDTNPNNEKKGALIVALVKKVDPTKTCFLRDLLPVATIQETKKRIDISFVEETDPFLLVTGYIQPPDQGKWWLSLSWYNGYSHHGGVVDLGTYSTKVLMDSFQID